MYAVIKTGGKQYRVRPGDLMVVDKLDGEPGATVAFDQVLLIGEGPAVTIGAPVIAGASVSAVLIETRKGKKIKVFKKIRRQGYRRTRGHRQLESVLRVTGLTGDGRSENWDGSVDLTPLAVLNARARNLARGMEEAASRTSKPRGEAKPVQTRPAKSRPEPKKAASVSKKSAPEPKKAASEPKKAAPEPKKAAKPAAAKKPAAKKTEAKKTEAKKPASKPKPKAAKAKPAKD